MLRSNCDRLGEKTVKETALQTPGQRKRRGGGAPSAGVDIPCSL